MIFGIPLFLLSQSFPTNKGGVYSADRSARWLTARCFEGPVPLEEKLVVGSVPYKDANHPFARADSRLVIAMR